MSVDAISANTTARSPVELSLSPLFSREYSALYKGIQAYRKVSESNPREAEKQQKAGIEARLGAIGTVIETPKHRKFHLFGVDVTPMPRPYAKTLEDKTIIYQPNTIEGNKPLNIGHSYSVLAALPPREETGHLPWAIPDLGRASQKFASCQSRIIFLFVQSPISYSSLVFM